MIILDEAVSALDKSVEAQVLNLLGHLKREFNLTYVFISHDLNVVQYISDRVLVMYLGQVVEIGSVDAIYDTPLHPYSRALLDSRLSMDPDDRMTEPPISGDPPNPVNPPSGCRFRTLCAFAETTGAIPGRLIEAVHDAYLGDPRVRAFLLAENPAAARAIAERLAAARRRGLWHPLRNSVDADLAELIAQARGREAA